MLLPCMSCCRGLGVLLNVILPAYLISILLFLLMCLLITQSLNKVNERVLVASVSGSQF